MKIFVFFCAINSLMIFNKSKKNDGKSKRKLTFLRDFDALKNQESKINLDFK